MSNQDVATKNYVDKNAFTTTGGTVPGVILIKVDSGQTGFLGCFNLDIGKEFIRLLGTSRNMIEYFRPKPDSVVPAPVKLNTSEGFVIMINSHPICGFSQNLIQCSQPIDMNQHSIKNIKSTVNKLDAVNKAYVDRIKYKSVTATIHNTVRTDHTLFTFPATKDIISEKIIICEMWVERLVGELVSTSSQMFATDWLGFHRFQEAHPL